jgi:hypothetical protein
MAARPAVTGLVLVRVQARELGRERRREKTMKVTTYNIGGKERVSVITDSSYEDPSDLISPKVPRDFAPEFTAVHFDEFSDAFDYALDIESTHNFPIVIKVSDGAR